MAAKGKPSGRAPAQSRTAPKRTPKQPKFTEGEKAIRHTWGAYNKTDGVLTKLDSSKKIQSFVNSQFNTPGSLNYRPIAENSGGGPGTPFSNAKGKSLGVFDSATGRFEITGKTYKKPVKGATVAARRTAFIQSLADSGNPKAQALMTSGYAGGDVSAYPVGGKVKSPPKTKGIPKPGAGQKKPKSAKLTAAAKKPASRGGKKVTAAERARIQKQKTRQQAARKRLRGGGQEPLADSTENPIYAEADISATGMLRAQGKAYALGRSSNASSRRGETGGGGEEEKGTGGGKNKRRRRKRGKLKTPGKGPKFSVKNGKVKTRGRPKNAK